MHGKVRDGTPNYRKLRAMTQFLKRMGDVLGVKVDVHLGKARDEYAFTVARPSPSQVHIDYSKLSWGNPVRAWLQVKGLFYHETVHLVADPVTDYEVTSRGQARIAKMLNLLSDQSGEVRFVSMYRGAKSYFAMNVFELILKRGGVRDPLVYALVYGRRSFLPARFVELARRQMVDSFSEGKVRKVEAIINEYHRKAGETDDQNVFYDLACELDKLISAWSLPGAVFEKIASGQMRSDAAEAGKDAGGPVKKLPASKDEKKSKAKDGSGRMGKADERDADTDDVDAVRKSKKGKASEEDEDDGGDDDDDSASDDIVDGSGAGDGVVADVDEEGKPEAGGKASRGGGGDLGEEDIASLAGDARDEALDDILETAAKETEELGLLSDMLEVSDVMQASHDLAALLRRVQMKAQSGYDSGFRAGRINIRRVMANQIRGEEWRTDVFQQFQPDKRNMTKLNIALIGDRSGSMGRNMEEMNQVFAAIALACEESNPVLNKTMIRYFNDTDLPRKQPNERFDERKSLEFSSYGSNHPGDSMKAALDWLKTETGAKVIIVLTDSEWDTMDCSCHPKRSDHNTKDVRDSVYTDERAQKEGVLIRVLHLGTTAYGTRWKRYKLEVQATTFAEMPEVVFELVRMAMMRQVKKVMT